MLRLVRFLSFPPLLVTVLTLAPLVLLEVEAPGTRRLAVAAPYDERVVLFALGACLAFYFSFIVGSGRLLPVTARQAWQSRASSGSEASLAGLPLVVLALAAAGVAVTMLVVSPASFSRLLQSAVSGVEDPELRWQIIGSEALPGVVKMFSYTVLSALTLLLAARSIPEFDTALRRRFSLLLVIVFGAVLVRGFVFLDRNTIVIAVVMIAFSFFDSAPAGFFDRFRRMVLVGSAAILVIVLASFQAVVRGGELRTDNPVLNYADLGAANFALAVDTTTRFALGANSIYQPLLFIPRAFGFTASLPDSDQAWVHNPAANLLAFAYTDFGTLGALSYLFWGALAGIAYRMKYLRAPSFSAGAIYLWVLFAASVVWVQPITRGPDFWCGLLVAALAGRYLDVRRTRVLRRDRASSTVRSARA